MDFIKNLKIQHKLLLIFGILTSMVVILAIFTFNTINDINAMYQEFSEGPIRRTNYVADALRELTSIRRYILSMGYVAEDDSAVNNYFNSCQESEKLFMRYMDNFSDSLNNGISLSDYEKKEFKEIIFLVKNKFTHEYKQYIIDVYEASLIKDSTLINYLILNGMPIGDEITKELNVLRMSIQSNAHTMSNETQAFARRSVVFIVIIAISIVIIVLPISIFMSRAIQVPIVNMRAAMDEIAKGNLSYPIRSVYKDELGLLSNHIGDMVDTISALNKTVTIVDNLDDMIFVTDLEYNIVYINQSALNLYGKTQEECIGDKCHKIFCKSDEACSFCPLPRLIFKKEEFPSCEWEHYVAEKDMWLSCKTSIIRWVDGNLAQIYICNDNTGKKKQEENQRLHEERLREAAIAAEDASRLKTVFLANMSHEIRTPMNGIIGFSELALDDNISPRTRNYLNKIKESSEGLLQIINDILDVSKIEAGKIVLESIPFDIHDVFKTCQALVVPKAKQKGITLFCYAEPSIGKKLIGDPTRLRQVLLNLLSNAVKFTNNGIIKLLSAIERTENDSVTMRFEVKDSGIGMSQQQITKIFEPFVQADDSTTRKYGGTGLGLAITKNIIELMGGSLNVESAIGVGSKFSFSLTFKTIDFSGELLEDEAMTNEFERPTFDGDVLICEDNAMNQQVLKEQLKKTGLSTVIACNGAECVDIVSQRIKNNERPFDLILMDIHMPVMDGLEAAEELIQLGNTTPIVAVTANVMPDDRKAYLDHGMIDYISKPFTTNELWSCLLKYFEPVRFKIMSENEMREKDEKLHKQLIISFVKENQNTFKSITDAVEAGDIELAHRLSHSLKGIAGLVKRKSLQEAAYIIETSLANGNVEFTNEQMLTLERELNATLKDFAPVYEESIQQVPMEEEFDIDRALALLRKLGPLIRVGNSECLDMLDELKKIPESEDLVTQIENYDFELAAESFLVLKNFLEKKREN